MAGRRRGIVVIFFSGRIRWCSSRKRLIKLAIAPFTPLPEHTSKLFDVLRALSAILVLVGHLFQIMVQPLFDHPLVTRGFYVMAGYSVMIFFVISGYMIGLSIYRNLSRHAFQRFDALAFARNRLLRLYPPLLLSVAICLAVLAFAKLRWSNDMELAWMAQAEPSLFASLLFVQNMFRGLFPTPAINAPLWSLSFEGWFYVIAALATSAVINRQPVSMVLLATVTFVFLMFGVQEAFLLGLAVWLGGFASAFLLQNFDLRSRAAQVSLVALTALVGALWFGAVLRLLPWAFEAKYAFGLLFTLAMLFALTQTGAMPKRFASTKVVQVISIAAPFSYTLYLIHYPLTHFLNGLLRPIGGSVALSVVAACCTFVIVMAAAKALAGIVEDKGAMRSLLVRPFR